MSDNAAPRVPLHRQPLPSKPPRWLRIVGVAFLLIVAAVIVLLLLFEWNWLRGPIGRLASARLDRTVELRGDLKVHPFHWSPRAEVNDLYVADTDWSRRPHLARVKRVEVVVRLLPLLRGEVILPRLAIVAPDANLIRAADGRSNWQFGEPDDDKKGAKLPAIQNLIVSDGDLAYDDAKSGIRLRATIDSSEREGGASRFSLRGDGSINKAPFKLRILGGPLINIDPDKPYLFTADVTAGPTRLTSKGSITKPFDLGRFQADVTLQGEDLNAIYGLTGLATPNTPPYKLSGKIVRDETLYSVSRFSGRVGDSDLGGRFTVETKGERPRFDGALVSSRLDYDDIAVVFGGAPDPSETANAAQRTVAAQRAVSTRYLPDATLKVEQVRAMDADVTFRAAAIVDAPVELRGVSLTVDLEKGVLDVSDLALGFPQGRLTGTARLDARTATPRVDVDFRIAGLALQQFLTKAGVSPITGNLLARIKLSGQGDSVRRAAATADGAVTLVIPRGEVREAFAELIGVNVIKGLGLLFSKDQGKVGLSCAIADFRATDGILRSSQLLADTEPVLITGGGTISLRDETVNLELKGNPKKFRLVSLNAPVTVTGTLMSPKPGVQAGGAIAQGGIGAALLAVVHPLAAILPFVDLGLAKDANCSALLGGAKAKGAPVTRAQAGRG